MEKERKVKKIIVILAILLIIILTINFNFLKKVNVKINPGDNMLNNN